MSMTASEGSRGGTSRDERLRRLLFVMAEASTVDDLVALALPILADYLGATAVAVFSAEPAGLRLLGEHATADVTTPDEQADPCVGIAYREDRAVGPQRADAGGAVWRSGLWLPLPGVDRPAGVLRVLRDTDAELGDEDRALLATVVRRMGAAVTQAHVMADAHQLGRDRAKLWALSADAAGKLDLQAVTQRIVDGVTTATAFDVAIVSVREGDICRRVAAAGVDQARIGLVTDFHRWADLLEPAFRRGEMSYLIPPGAASVEWEEVPRLPEGEGPDAWTAEHGLVVELLDARGDIVGFLSVDEPRSGRLPSDEEIETLELFARQAQVTLVNAQLYEETARRRDAAETLRRVGEAVSSSLELPRVLELCCRVTVEQSVADRAWIYLFDAGTELFKATMYYQAGTPADAHATEEIPPATMAQMPRLADAVRSGNPALIDDLGESGLIRGPEVDRFRSCSGVVYPMLAAGEVVGVLILGSGERGVTFPAEELELMQQIAGQTAIAIRQARLHADARDYAERTRDLLELTKAMTKTLELSAIVSHIVSALRARMRADRVAVFEAEGDEIRLLHVVTNIDQRPPVGSIPMTPDIRVVADTLLETGAIILDDPQAHPALGPYILPGAASLLLAGHGEPGAIELVMAVTTRVPRAFNRGDAEFCDGLVEVLALAVRNARLYEEARRAAERDSLTGLLNRRMFWPQLQAQVESATVERPTALAVLDIDDFKQVNDQYGHDAGDRALRHVTDRLLRNVRETDFVYRLGGEEFTVVMPHTSADEARGVLERVISALGRSRRDVPRLTISAGIALAPVQGTSGDTLFRAADRSLYAAKHAGKNRIVVA